MQSTTFALQHNDRMKVFIAATPAFTVSKNLKYIYTIYLKIQSSLVRTFLQHSSQPTFLVPFLQQLCIIRSTENYGRPWSCIFGRTSLKITSLRVTSLLYSKVNLSLLNSLFSNLSFQKYRTIGRRYTQYILK